LSHYVYILKNAYLDIELAVHETARIWGRKMRTKLREFNTRMARRWGGPTKGDSLAREDLEETNWQKEILWTVVTEGLIEKNTLIGKFEERGAENAYMAVEGMIANGFLEDINSYIRVHPNFAENCYAVIRG
jgi:hypothetical protein